MSKTVTTSLSVGISGDGYAAAPLYSSSTQNLSGAMPDALITINGFSAVPVPATAVGVTLVPPPGSTLTKTLKGITGDTGIVLHPTQPTSLAFTAGVVATFGIACTGVETIQLIWQ